MTCNICKSFENIGSFIVGCTYSGPADLTVQSESMVTTDEEVLTVENASGAVSTMPTSSLISNSNFVTDDSDEDDNVSDEDYENENNG